MERQKPLSFIQSNVQTKHFQQKKKELTKQYLTQLIKTTNIKFFYGDLLKASTKYIAHQCNCKTEYAKGLAKQMFQTYEKANTYNKKRKQGTIDVININQKRTVINLYAQYKQGKPDNFETREKRKKWFCQTLQKVSEIQQIKEVAIPNEIGCGLAGGNWSEYLLILLQWSLSTKIQLHVYCFRQKGQQIMTQQQYLSKFYKTQSKAQYK